MVGASTDKLYEIDPVTGAAAAVGSAVGFGIPGGGEGYPSGLTSHGADLYMTGTAADSLYILDTTTGAAAPVGTLTGLGVSEHDPQGIANRTEVFAIDPSTGVIAYTGYPATAGAEYTLNAQVIDHQTTTGRGTSYTADTTTIKITVVDQPSLGQSGTQTSPPGQPGTESPPPPPGQPGNAVTATAAEPAGNRAAAGPAGNRLAAAGPAGNRVTTAVGTAGNVNRNPKAISPTLKA